MEKVVLIAAALLGGYAVVYQLLKKKIERSCDPEALLGRIREEVNRIIVELNQTTDRNIALVEDRIGRLMDLLAKADKKIGLLQREGEKHEVSAKLYSALAKSKAPPEPEPEAGKDVREEVIRLHQAGFPASLISRRLGAPLGEVELIISLSERKR